MVQKVRIRVLINFASFFIALNTHTGQFWKPHRRHLNPAFNINLSTKLMIRDQSDNLIKRLHKFCNGNDFNILPILFEASLGISLEVLMGKKFTEQENHKVYLEIKEYSKKFSRTTKFYLLNVICKAIFDKSFIPQEFGLFPSAEKILHEREKEYFNYLITQKSTSVNEKNVLSEKFIDKIIQYKHNNPSDEFSTEDHLMFGINASFDTSALAIANTILLLAMHPDVQEKCYEEIINVTGTENSKIELETLSQLEYLSMTIKETHRLLTIVPFIGRKLGCDIETG